VEEMFSSVSCMHCDTSLGAFIAIEYDETTISIVVNDLRNKQRK
jgi:hypothetical protein